MQKYDDDILGLADKIEQITDRIALILNVKSGLSNEEIEAASELYKQRGELINNLNGQFYSANNVDKQNSGQFRESIQRIQIKNDLLNTKINELTSEISQRLRMLAKQSALAAYSE